MSLLSYMLAAMISWVPLNSHAYYEPVAQTEARYRAIAEDVLEASAYNPIFANASESKQDGAARTALLTLSWAGLESFYVKRIDECHPLKGESDSDANGNPTAWSLWQMHIERGRMAKVLICESRKAAVSAFLVWMKDSFSSCRALSLGDRGSLYAAGKCGENPKSRHRILRAIAWAKEHPFPTSTDKDEVFASISNAEAHL